MAAAIKSMDAGTAILRTGGGMPEAAAKVKQVLEAQGGKLIETAGGDYLLDCSDGFHHMQITAHVEPSGIPGTPEAYAVTLKEGSCTTRFLRIYLTFAAMALLCWAVVCLGPAWGLCAGTIVILIALYLNFRPSQGNIRRVRRIIATLQAN